MSDTQDEIVTPPTRDDDEAPPEGFQQVTSDIVAFWEAASPGKDPRNKDNNNPKFWYREDYGYKAGSPPILFTPIDCVMQDSKLEPDKKSSTLVFGRLERACKLRSAVESEGYKEFAPGSLIGIWTKPGMRELQKLAGAKVWMRNGIKINEEIILFKAIDKPSPMVQFDIRSEGKGSALPVREDRRDKSLPQAMREKRAAVAQEVGDIPF